MREPRETKGLERQIREGRTDPGFVPREFEHYQTIEQNGVYVAQRSSLDLREGPGVRVAVKDDQDADRITARVGKRALGGRSHLSSDEGITQSAWTRVNVDTERYNFGGCQITGTRGAGSVAYQLDVTGVWLVIGNVYIVGLTGGTEAVYGGLQSTNTTRHGSTASGPNLAQTGKLVSDGGGVRVGFSTIHYFDAGDAVSLHAFHTFGSARDADADVEWGNYLAVEFLGEPDHEAGFDYSATNPNP